MEEHVLYSLIYLIYVKCQAFIWKDRAMQIGATPQEAVEKVEITFKSHPREGGGTYRQAHLVLEWMPARLWRIYDLRGQDLEMDIFDSLLKFE